MPHALLKRMPFLSIIVVLAVVGVLVYLFNTLIPMDARFKTVINVLIGLGLFLYVMQVFFGVDLFGGAGFRHYR